MRYQGAFTLTELVLVVAIVAILAAIALPAYEGYASHARNARAASDIKSIESAIERYFVVQNRLPDSLDDAGGAPLDPWDNPYQYLNVSAAKNHGKSRKDHNLVPINSDYDLYSMGPDGRSVSPLTAKASRDDIIRANNGAFVGPASEY